MAVKVTIKVGQGNGPLIVLKHPELQWKLHCINQGQGRVFLVHNCHEPLSEAAGTGEQEVQDGYMLPAGTRSLRLMSKDIPEAFSAHLIGASEDAVSAN